MYVVSLLIPYSVITKEDITMMVLCELSDILYMYLEAKTLQ